MQEKTSVQVNTEVQHNMILKDDGFGVERFLKNNKPWVLKRIQITFLCSAGCIEE